MSIHSENRQLYSKGSKISHTLLYTTLPPFFLHFFHKTLGGMANSVGPDQTAPEGAV